MNYMAGFDLLASGASHVCNGPHHHKLATRR
jgi:hypothetical protein